MRTPRLGTKWETKSPKTVKSGGIAAPQMPTTRRPPVDERQPLTMDWYAKPVAQPGVIQGKTASSWEMLVAAELSRRNLRYDFQVDVWGGKARPGGKVIDFVVYSMPTTLIRVQGTYWHGGSYEANKDRVERMLLQAQYPTCNVIDISEVEIEDPTLLRRLLSILGYR